VSDYLSKLVARSLGVANVVRPLATSLFEPRDAAPHHLLAETFLETGDPPQSRAREPGAQTELPADVADERSGGLSAGDPPPAREPLAPLPGSARAEVPDPPGPLREEASGAEPSEANPARGERKPAVVVRAKAPVRRMEGLSSEPRLARTEGRSPEPRRGLPPPLPGQARDEAPVVHVTIGRVDVRAVQSGPPAAPPAPAPEGPPVQPLAEYLRRGARS
jgi:hypothetical protein